MELVLISQKRHTPASDSDRCLPWNGWPLGGPPDPSELIEPLGLETGCGDCVCRVSSCLSIAPLAGAEGVPSDV